MHNVTHVGKHLYCFIVVKPTTQGVNIVKIVITVKQKPK